MANPRSSLWADKYAPRTTDELIGMATTANRLRTWLRTWSAVHVDGTAPKPKWDRLNPGGRSALLSGPPGIGKTSLAHLIANELDFEVLELNASDARSKKALEKMLKDALQTTVFSFVQTKKKKRCVVMDEVDGMSAGDRGGLQALMKMIKTSKTPVICICNDRAKQAVRTLAKNSYDLRCSNPRPETVLRRLKEICAAEKFEIPEARLKQLILASKSDVRHLINDLHILSRAIGDVSQSVMQKDGSLTLTHFDVTPMLFTQSHQMPLKMRTEAFFVDMDIVPLVVAEVYPRACAFNWDGKQTPATICERLAICAERASYSDLLNSKIRTKNRWDLLPAFAMENVRLAYDACGPASGGTFPRWLGENSKRSKKKRLLNELVLHSRASAFCVSTGMRLDYVNCLREHVAGPLLNTKTDPSAVVAQAVESTLGRLDDYGFSRDDLFENLNSFDLRLAQDPMAGLPAKTKSAFTRAYNKTSHRKHSHLLEEMTKAKVKKKKKNAGGDDDDDGGGDDDEETIEETLEMFQAKKRKRAAKAKHDKKKAKLKK